MTGWFGDAQKIRYLFVSYSTPAHASRIPKWTLNSAFGNRIEVKIFRHVYPYIRAIKLTKRATKKKIRIRKCSQRPKQNFQHPKRISKEISMSTSTIPPLPPSLLSRRTSRTNILQISHRLLLPPRPTNPPLIRVLLFLLSVLSSITLQVRLRFSHIHGW